jgi:hypothetical protein
VPNHRETGEYFFVGFGEFDLHYETPRGCLTDRSGAVRERMLREIERRC